MKRIKGMFFAVMAAFLIMAGCSGPAQTSKKTNTPIQSIGAPDWVVKGSGAFGGEKGKVFYGVQSSANIQNASLLRSTADNRARNEVAKVLKIFSASLANDYMASTSATEANVSSEEQHVEQAMKTVTAMTLSGVEIVDHWQNPETGEFFALARLDLNAFNDSLEKTKELNEKVKTYIRQNAERLHQKLETEVEKVKEPAGN